MRNHKFDNILVFKDELFAFAEFCGENADYSPDELVEMWMSHE